MVERFDPEWTDKAKIQRRFEPQPCRICMDVFARVRLSWRYCNRCERAFCEGEHGALFGGSQGVCVRCYGSTSGEMS